MNTRLSDIFYTCFHILFLMIFGWVFINILFFNKHYPFNSALLLFSAALFICLFLGLYFKLKKIQPSPLENAEKFILPIFFFLLFALQLAVGIAMETVPAWDFEAVYGGAQSLALNGDITGRTDYFYKFPNNLGGTIFLSIPFKLFSFFGAENYHIIATVFNILLIQASVFFAYLIVKRLFGIQLAFCALILFALIPAIYFFSPIYYTDTLSMVFPILTYYLYLRAKDAEKKAKWLWLIAFGLVASFGMQVKMTTVIVVVAIFIEYCFTCDKKRLLRNLLKYASTAAAAFIGLNLLFNLFVSAYMLPSAERLSNDTTPYAHWIMMGLQGNGAYNPDDYSYTDSFSTTAERRNADIRIIKERLSAMNAKDFIQFYTNKAIYNWGDGTFSAGNFLGTNPVHHTFLHEMSLDNGIYNATFSFYCQAIFILLLMLMLLAIIGNLFGKKNKHFGLIVALFGIFAFSLLWESNSRYLVNYIPIYVVIAVAGLDALYHGLAKFTSLKRNSKT